MNFYYYNRHDYDTVIPLVKMTLPFHALTILLDGKMIYNVNGERVEMHSGDIIFLKKGTVRTREEVRNSQYVSYNFYEDDYDFLPLLSHGLLSKTALHTVYAYDEGRKTTHDLSDPRLILLFRALTEELRYQIKLKNENELVQRVKKCIHERFREKLTLADISQHVFFSVPYIEKIFKAETGESIIHYLIDFRLQIAKNLLLDNTIDLKIVAKQSGFSDYNFFSRTFSKFVGFSPSAYRKKYGFSSKK